jgi:hypothetical protein
MDGQGPEWTQYLGGIVDGSAEVLEVSTASVSWSMNIVESRVVSQISGSPLLSRSVESTLD